MMTLDEYRKSTDTNAFWRLQDGETLNLLDEAIERLDEAEALLRECLKCKLHPLNLVADIECALDRKLKAMTEKEIEELEEKEGG